MKEVEIFYLKALNHFYFVKLSTLTTTTYKKKKKRNIIFVVSGGVL